MVTVGVPGVRTAAYCFGGIAPPTAWLLGTGDLGHKRALWFRSSLGPGKPGGPVIGSGGQA
jgi:hypothetical protein